MAMVEVKQSPEGVPGAVADPSRLIAEELTYPGAGDTPVNGYLVRPLDAVSAPAMVVIHEAGGLGEHIRDVANRFANLGYVALAVDLYTREGGPPPMDDMQELMKRLFSISDATVLGDLEGAADLLRAREDVNGKVGCIGFCMGGRYTLLFATRERPSGRGRRLLGRLHRPRHARGAHARPSVPRLRSSSPSNFTARCSWRSARRITIPRPRSASSCASARAASGQPVAVDVYEGAGHAFFADYRPSYRPEAAAKLWTKVVPFLERHLEAQT